MTVLVTGAAGFIGFHVAAALLDRGENVVGLDNLCDYYDVALKEARLARLDRLGFRFCRADLGDAGALEGVFEAAPDINRIVHLAAQAGVRDSLENPGIYVQTNLVGHCNVLEAARRCGSRLCHLVYASSSSVYGGNDKLPFSVADRVDRPVSLYAATKKADELLSFSYSHTHRIPATGLRFFTVYGPWGRPDMAAWIFTRGILAGEPIAVFNHGDMERDFVYIDDLVAGVLAALDRVPEPDAGGTPHRVYNLGNNRPDRLMDFIGAIEAATGRKAEIDFRPMQPGDVRATAADIDTARRDLGFEPVTTVAAGIPKFVDWYRRYHDGEL